MLSSTASSQGAVRLRLVSSFLALFLICSPIFGSLYVILSTLVNAPLEDDYEALVEFLQTYIAQPTWGSRAAWVLTSQHTQYKLILTHILVILQYHLFGHLNFSSLEILGDLGIPAVIVLLWLLLARTRRAFTQRIWLFVPISCSYLILNYRNAANWPMGGLQTLLVVPFVMAMFLCWTRPGPRSFALGSVFLILGVFTSSNAFIAALLGILFFLSAGRRKAALAAGAELLALAALYAWRLHPYTPEYVPLARPQLLRSLLATPFVFAGSLTAELRSALCAGLLLVAVFLWLWHKGWRRADPASFWLTAFCFVTALAVDATRFRFGAGVGLSDRYRMYSALLLALELLGIIHVVLPARVSTDRRAAAALALWTAVCFVASLRSIVRSDSMLMARKHQLERHIILWEQQPQALILIPDEEPYKTSPFWMRLRVRYQADAAALVRSGLWRPPVHAGDPLPR